MHKIYISILILTTCPLTAAQMSITDKTNPANQKVLLQASVNTRKSTEFKVALRTKIKDTAERNIMYRLPVRHADGTIAGSGLPIKLQNKVLSYLEEPKWRIRHTLANTGIATSMGFNDTKIVIKTLDFNSLVAHTQVWNLTDGALEQIIRHLRNDQYQDAHGIWMHEPYAVIFGAHGKEIQPADETFWDCAKMDAQRVLQQHGADAEQVLTASFNAKGNALATALNNNSTTVWESVDLANELRQGQEMALGRKEKPDKKLKACVPKRKRMNSSEETTQLLCFQKQKDAKD